MRPNNGPSRATEKCQERLFVLRSYIDFEQKWNKIRTINKQEDAMSEILQDVVSMVCMSAFLISTALWIGAL
ncbi:hypothetical protein DY251_07445 [Mesorhizobium denitrificans]|uniref:Uncharacterized protein n=1 Tax=Mesorhizobium denitrificans TaxID=2294114 RepID=A0A371XFU7_9HYPH|nr:hypothetical protein DY251_07445 [Mesorhizobium denitrificans]